MVVTFGMIEVSSYLLYALGGRSMAGADARGPRRWFNRVTGAIFRGVRAGDRGEPGLSCRM
jgi:threonine/homoserine/homoserine lactone efflux protein